MRQDGALLDLALQRVEALVGRDDRLRERACRGATSASIASASIFSAMPPISAMRAAQVLQLVVEGRDDVVGHGMLSLAALPAQPNRPVM